MRASSKFTFTMSQVVREMTVSRNVSKLRSSIKMLSALYRFVARALLPTSFVRVREETRTVSRTVFKLAPFSLWVENPFMGRKSLYVRKIRDNM